MTSGLKANTHSGQGALLRNIRISGGTASAVVNLPNTEDCMQYCTGQFACPFKYFRNSNSRVLSRRFPSHFTVPLPSAYGIYSWSPLPPSATTPVSPSGSQSSNDITPAPQPQQQGECSCMSRISSLEYSFGSRSAIFPPISNL